MTVLSAGRSRCWTTLPACAIMCATVHSSCLLPEEKPDDAQTCGNSPEPDPAGG